MQRVRAPTRPHKLASRAGSPDGTSDADAPLQNRGVSRSARGFAMKTQSQLSCILFALVIPLAACGGDKPSSTENPYAEMFVPKQAAVGFGELPKTVEQP